MTVLSIQKHTLTLAGGVFTASQALNGSPVVANCVPFTMTRITANSSNNPDAITDYLVNTDFTGSSVRVTRVGDNPSETQAAVVCEVTVVEFDPTKVNVYSGQTVLAGQTHTITDAFGAGPVTVDLTKAWLYFTYNTNQSPDLWRAHAMRGKIATNSTLEFNKSQSQGTDQIFNWWVCECINTEWEVRAIQDLVLANPQTTVSSGAFTAVNPAKSFILGSREGAETFAGDDGDGNDENTIDVTLGGANTTVTLTRQSGTNAGPITWDGFVVQLNGSESVQRGQLQQNTSVATQNVSITPVTAANCWVHTAGHIGTIGGGSFPSTSASSDDVPDAFAAWTFVDGSTIQCAHSTFGGEANNNITWEVIDWAISAPAPTGRVLWR